MSGSVSQVSLAGRLGLRDVGRLAQDLDQALKIPGPVTVDCISLVEIDLSVVQLLIAAHRTATATGSSLTIRYTADGPLGRLLKVAGFLTAAGAPLADSGRMWTNPEARAA